MQSTFHGVVEALTELFFMALDKRLTAASIERARARWSTPGTLTVIKLGTEQGAFHLGVEAGEPLAPDEPHVPLYDLLGHDTYQRGRLVFDALMPKDLEGILSEGSPSEFLRYLDTVALSLVAARVQRRFSSARVFVFFNDENPFPSLLQFPNDLCAEEEDELEEVLTALKLEPPYLEVLRDLFRAGQHSTARGTDPLAVGERFLQLATASR